MKTTDLWPGSTIESTLTAYPAPVDQRTGASMVVCPGGGYQFLADHEGEPVALWLNTLGIDAHVLKYRLGPDHRHPAMWEDVSRAVRSVRSTADDPRRVGVLGFSAGGHLASTISTHFDTGNTDANDPVDRISSRPDLSVLIYPVITMEHGIGHAGSRQNLIGVDASAEIIELLSSDLQVTTETPPAFLVHSVDDQTVAVEHSLRYAAALRRMGVPVEMHLYEHGGHGYGLGDADPALGEWKTACAHWLRRHGFAR